MKHVVAYILVILFLGLSACQPDTTPGECEDCTPQEELLTGPYQPTPYQFNLPSWIPQPVVPADNPMLVEGIALGRRLFYDPILSVDSTQACASCHHQSMAFTDGQAVSLGVRGLPGKRSSMALVNLAYNTRGFFWDGRSLTLEEQALVPVEDHLEMNDTWENVERKLRRHPIYPALFRAAFGIDRRSEITRQLVVKAIAQFERTLISANSRYDQVIWGKKGFPTDEEQRGLELFFIEDNQSLDHPGCSHCHFNPLFTDNNFRNNGLDDVGQNLSGFADLGRGGVNGNMFDNGKFRVPTLRNITLTAPYMHDGRFATLNEVLDHYSSGGHGVSNEDPNIRPFSLSPQDKQDLIAFLEMLTDTSFVQNPAFANPFK